MDIELLPCPHCGGEARPDIDARGNTNWIECSLCGSQGASIENYNDVRVEESLAEAADLWNRRIPHSLAGETVEAEALLGLRHLQRYAADTFDYWDSDQDSKVGKRLLAMSGERKGYDHELDAELEAAGKSTVVARMMAALSAWEDHCRNGSTKPLYAAVGVAHHTQVGKTICNYCCAEFSGGKPIHAKDCPVLLTHLALRPHVQQRP